MVPARWPVGLHGGAAALVLKTFLFFFCFSIPFLLFYPILVSKFLTNNSIALDLQIQRKIETLPFFVVFFVPVLVLVLCLPRGRLGLSCEAVTVLFKVFKAVFWLLLCVLELFCLRPCVCISCCLVLCFLSLRLCFLFGFVFADFGFWVLVFYGRVYFRLCDYVFGCPPFFVCRVLSYSAGLGFVKICRKQRLGLG